MWRSCPGHGVEFPSLRSGGERATRTIFVHVEPTFLRPGGNERCGQFTGNQIILYRFAHGERRRLLWCGSLALNLAHEIGHVLGLVDADRGAACSRHIMAPIDAVNRQRRSVTPDDCAAVGRRWPAAAEATLPIPAVSAIWPRPAR